jgi:hypothetical protein
MRKSLLEFLNLSDNKFIVEYPEFLNANNIIAFIISNPDLAGKNVAIVTENSSSINSSLSVPLPNELYVDYNSVKSSEYISELILQPSIIIIDNFELYNLYKLFELQSVPECKIICLNSDLNQDIDEYIKINLTIYNQGPVINYKLVTIDKSNNLNVKIQTIILSKITHNHYVYSDGLTIPNVNTNIKNIEYLHLIKIPTYKELRELLNKLYKIDFISDKFDIFNIIFYIDTEIESDLTSYETLVNSIQSLEEKRISLQDAPKMKFNLDTGLYIEFHDE